MSGAVYGSAISVDANYVYWTERRTGQRSVVRRIPRGGGSATVLVDSLNNAQRYLVANDAYLFLVDQGPQGNNQIWRVTKSDGSRSVLATAQSFSGFGVAVGSGWVYYADDASGIRKVAVTGGSSELVIQGARAIEIALTGSYVVWADYVNGEIRRASASGGGSVLLSSANSPAGIAASGDRVYWIEASSPGGVRGVSMSGGDAVMLGAPGNSYGIAVTDTYVFWSTNETSTTSRILRIER